MEKKEYKTGEVPLVAAMIDSGLKPIRIDKSYSDKDGNSKTRVVFVFDKTEASEIELKYLSKQCMVDARSFMDTINDIRNIIRNTVENRNI